ncbi:MAG: phospholipase D-like domain-containing protein [Candidatus Promineifilaceae bacterium]
MAKGKSSKGPLGIVGVIIVLILMALSYFLGVDLLGVGNDVEEPVVVSTAGDWYQIYFTNPTCPPEDARSGGLDETIAEDILRAQSQVDMAAFDFDAEPMVNALIELEKRGVVVRVITDEDNGSLSSINRLRRNGISVVEDKRSALMHDKFIVIDGRYVWTGSLNYTTNGVYCNNNNVVRFDSPELAANYTAELSEMYDDRAFGPTSPDNTPNKALSINGVRIDNYFASEDDVAPTLAALINNADQEILFMAFSFTLEDIGDAMINRAKEGVTVRGVFETSGSETDFSYYPIMLSEGIPVRQDGNPRVMHHKVIIIDRDTVVFGSYNFSNSANDSNDENLLIVYDPTFAQAFVGEFERVWSEARPG